MHASPQSGHSVGYATDAFSVFLKAEALVLLKLSFKVGARVSLSAMARALRDSRDGALSKLEASDADRDAALLLLVNVSAATEPATATTAATFLSTR